MKRPGVIRRRKAFDRQGVQLRRRVRLAARNEARRKRREAAYQSYLRSPAWKAKRLACLARAGYQCEHVWHLPGETVRCAATERLTVHHLTYARFRRERPEDLQCLCWPCHQRAEARVRPWNAHYRHQRTA